MFSRLSPLPGPTAVELRNFLASEDDAMRQLRRSGLFVANGSHPAKSPVGATSSASMPLLRSFGFLPFALYKYAAPMADIYWGQINRLGSVLGRGGEGFWII
jgi:hypothetical protein